MGDPGSLSALEDTTFYNNLRLFSYNDHRTFIKIGEIIKTSNMTDPAHFGIVHNPNHSRYLDPVCNPGSFSFCIKTSCWNRLQHTALCGVTWSVDTVQLTSVTLFLNYSIHN